MTTLKFPESSFNHLHLLLLLRLPLVPLLSYYWLLWLWWLVSFELLKNLKQPVRTSFLIIYSPRSTTSSTRATISQSATTFKSGRKTLTGMDKHNSNLRVVSEIVFLSLKKAITKHRLWKSNLSILRTAPMMNSDWLSTVYKTTVLWWCHLYVSIIGATLRSEWSQFHQLVQFPGIIHFRHHISPSLLFVPKSDFNRLSIK